MSLTVFQLVGLQTSKNFNIAGLAILVFDYTLTLEDEIKCVWGRQWDVTRCIFMVSRYLPFVGTGLTAYAALRSSSDPCPPSLAENIIHILSIIAAELLLILRTYAFYQGNKRVLYGLLAYGCVTIGAAVAINVTHEQLLPGGYQAPPGCLMIGSRNSTLVYLVLLVFEIVILSMTAYKRFRSYRVVRTPIMLTVYRDGMFYTFCIILITFSNVLLDGLFPLQFSNLLDIPQITLHSVLASRIMFNLRKSCYCEQEEESANSMLLGDLKFHSPSNPREQREVLGSASFA